MSGELEEQILRIVYDNLKEKEPEVNLKLSKNTKGYNWEITVLGARSPEEALDMVAWTRTLMLNKLGIEDS